MSYMRSLEKKMVSPFLTLNILHILNDGMLASLPLLLPFIQRDLNIEFGKIGILTSAIGLAGISLALPSASFARMFGGLKILIISAFIYSFAFVITGISTSFFILSISFIIASVGFGVFHPISFSVIAQMSDSSETGTRMGSFTAIGDIGRVGISAFVTIFVSFINWRNTSFIYAVFSAGVIMTLLILNHKKGMFSEKKSYWRIEKVHGLHSTPIFINSIITGFIDALASSTIFVFIPFLFVFRGASTAVIGSMTGAFFIGNMIGKITLGTISDKIGNKKIFIISEIVMAILLIAMSKIENIYGLTINSILLGAVTKGTVPIINTLIANSIPEKRLIEKGFGINALTTGIAATLAPIAYGFIAERHSILSVFYFSAFFALCAPIPICFHSISNSFNKNKKAT